MVETDSFSKWSALLATGLAGVMTGCLTFVSAVDTRSFLTHIDKQHNNTELARSHFQIWWPYGRDLMVPLIGTTTLAQGATWYSTRNNSWVISGICLLLVGPYTAIVLGEDIEKLRRSSSTEVADTTKRFCRLHHVRLALAAVGFGVSLVSLADLKK